MIENNIKNNFSYYIIFPSIDIKVGQNWPIRSDYLFVMILRRFQLPVNMNLNQMYFINPVTIDKIYEVQTRVNQLRASGIHFYSDREMSDEVKKCQKIATINKNFMGRFAQIIIINNSYKKTTKEASREYYQKSSKTSMTMKFKNQDDQIVYDQNLFMYVLLTYQIPYLTSLQQIYQGSFIQNYLFLILDIKQMHVKRMINEPKNIFMKQIIYVNSNYAYQKLFSKRKQQTQIHRYFLFIMNIFEINILHDISKKREYDKPNFFIYEINNDNQFNQKLFIMQKIPQCMNKFQATMVCIDSKCKQINPFICSGVNCPDNKCKTVHRRCSKNQWSIFKQILDEENNLAHQLSNRVSNIVEELIYKSIKLLYSELDQLKKWRSLSTNNKNVRELYEDIEKNNEVGWTGSRLISLLNMLEIQNKQDKINTQVKIEKDSKLILGKLQELQKAIKKIYSVEQYQESQKQLRRIQIINPCKQWNIYMFDINKFKNGEQFRNWTKEINIEADIHYRNLRKFIDSNKVNIGKVQAPESIIQLLRNHQLNRVFIEFIECKKE